MPKKGSRKIRVGAIDYRWLAVPQADRLMVLVEAFDRPGQQLRAYFDYGWPPHYNPAEALYSGASYSHRGIRPSEVAALIQLGLHRGWQPSREDSQALDLPDAESVIRDNSA